MCYNVIMKNHKKLYRSTDDKVIAGVCGGLGEYFDIDSTIIRIVFILLAVSGGSGIIIYLVMALIVPTKKGSSDIKANAEDLANQTKKVAENFKNSENKKNFLGIIVVTIGFLVLLKNLVPVKLAWLNSGVFWSLIIIFIGLFLITKNKK